jgi:hypothetical protein
MLAGTSVAANICSRTCILQVHGRSPRSRRIDEVKKSATRSLRAGATAVTAYRPTSLLSGFTARHHVGLISTRGPAVVVRADTNVLAEAPRAMALIRKAGRYCNLRKRKVGAGEQLHGAFDPTSDQIVVRRHSFGFLERAREIKLGQARNTGKHVDADLLAKVRIDVFADPAQSLRRKAAPYARDRRGADCLVGAVDESRTSRRRGNSDCAGRLARQR